ncbi:probable solanesyl-diphosphate synthase 3, chloroplastic [Miscanthus floridulus]|uniref:probable solanesyl-diphosphate synthase 3, chloroplastic n=1 Tax=Miscanthus floridulus TaxID=154761 RepID=UPI003459CB50
MSMAAPSSSLASSSHLSRRATATATATAAAQSHSPPLPQQLRLGCFQHDARAQSVRLRYSWACRAASKRRTPGVCFVVSPSQPGLAAIDVPAATIPNATTVPDRSSVSSLLEVVSDDLLKLNNNLKSVSVLLSRLLKTAAPFCSVYSEMLRKETYSCDSSSLMTPVPT